MHQGGDVVLLQPRFTADQHRPGLARGRRGLDGAIQGLGIAAFADDAPPHHRHQVGRQPLQAGRREIGGGGRLARFHQGPPGLAIVGADNGGSSCFVPPWP